MSGNLPRSNRCLVLALTCAATAVAGMSPSDAAPSAAPPPGLVASAADPSTGTVVGLASSPGSNLAATWVWNGTVWKQRSPFGVVPPMRSDTAMAYDAATKTVVLFGGQSGSSISAGNFRIHGDTFVWNGRTNTWSMAAPDVSPSPRIGPTLAYDAATRTVLLFGGTVNTGNHAGQLNDTWAWNGATQTWALQNVPVSPLPRRSHAMAEDKVNKTVVLFGGMTSPSLLLGDTWVWNGAARTWTEQSPANKPSPRRSARMAYDGARSNAVLFGGDNVNSLLTDTWTWNGTNWKQRALTGLTPPASGSAMAYHAATQKVVLVSGDTWLWNGISWKRPL